MGNPLTSYRKSEFRYNKTIRKNLIGPLTHWLALCWSSGTISLFSFSPSLLSWWSLFLSCDAIIIRKGGEMIFLTVLFRKRNPVFKRNNRHERCNKCYMNVCMFTLHTALLSNGLNHVSTKNDYDYLIRSEKTKRGWRHQLSIFLLIGKNSLFPVKQIVGLPSIRRIKWNTPTDNHDWQQPSLFSSHKKTCCHVISPRMTYG